MPQYTYPEDFEGTFWTVVDGAYYVSTVGNDITGDGSPKKPFLTVEHAFGLAEDGEKIIIGPDEYVSFKPIDVSPSGALVPCRAATVGNFTIGSGGGGVAVVDGIQTQTGDRVLVWQQTNLAENGIYIVNSGTWTRATDFDSINTISSGKLIPVLEGTENGTRTFQHVTAGSITIETTPIIIQKAEGAETDWGEIQGNISNQTDLSNALNLKADNADLTNHTSDIGNPHGVTKTQVGLGNADNTSDTAKPISSTQQSALDLKADKSNVLELDNTTSYTPSTDNHPATKKFVEDQIAALDKATPKGLIDASSNPNYPAGILGDYYYVSVAGKIGGTSGSDVQVGDKIQCIADNAGGTQTTVGNSWIIFQGNLDKATVTEAQDGTNDEKYLTPQKGFQGWDSWINNKIVNELNTINQTIVGAINELQTSRGDVFKVGTPVADQLAIWTGDGTLSGTPAVLFEEDQLKTEFDVTIGTSGGEGDGTIYLTRTNTGFAAIDLGIGWSLRTYQGESIDSEFGIFNNGSGENVMFFESGNRITISDAGGGIGAQYAGDYSSGNTVNDRWIPDKAYVDAAVAGVGGVGDVLKVGTPVNNQLAVWTGDGTIEGDSDLTWSGTRLDLRSSGTQKGALNTSGDNNGFELLGNNNGADPSIHFKAIVQSAGDAGTEAVFSFKGTLNNTTELSVRPILNAFNLNSKLFEVGANGNWDFQANNLSGINIVTVSNVILGGAGIAGNTVSSVSGDLILDSSSGSIAIGNARMSGNYISANSTDVIYYGAGTGISKGGGIHTYANGNVVNGGGVDIRPRTTGLLRIYHTNTIMATMDSLGTWDYQGHLLKNLANPVDAQDAATKTYVDTAISGVGGGVSFGTVSQIPTTNSALANFDYTNGFTYDGSRLIAEGTGSNSVSIGRTAEAEGTNTISIGFDAGNTLVGTIGEDTISIGASANGGNFAVGRRAIGIGYLAQSIGEQSVAIGYNSFASEFGSLIVGSGSNNRPFSFTVGLGGNQTFYIEMKEGATINNIERSLGSEIILDDNTFYQIEVDTSGLGGLVGPTLNTEWCAFKIIGTFYRVNGGSVTRLGTDTIIHAAESNAGLNARLNPIGDNVEVLVTGLSGHNFFWKALVTLTPIVS